MYNKSFFKKRHIITLFFYAPGSFIISYLLGIKLIAAAGVFLVQLVPHLIIHINYLYNTKDLHLKVSNRINEIGLELKKEEKTVWIAMSKIEKVVSFITLPHREDRTYWFPWDGYNYSIIYSEGMRFVVTNLVVDALEFPVLESVRHEIKNQFYPMVWSWEGEVSNW